MAGLNYERGNPDRPKGHAFLYFTNAGGSAAVATYLVVPPITIDVAKYVPPLLASSLASGAIAAEASFLPIPPVPEPTDLAQILTLAELRDDDILAGGLKRADDPGSLMSQVVEIGDAYAQAYRESLTRVSPSEPTPAQPTRESPQVRALMYATLSERERLEALARELGALRYGLEGGDTALVEATLAEMAAIAASLPAKYRAHELIEAAKRADPLATRLAELYLERCFKISTEDYEALSSIEAQIALLHGDR